MGEREHSTFSKNIAVSEIVKALNDSGVPAPYAADSWSRESVVYLLEDRICRDTVVPAAESYFINYSGQKLFYVKSAGSIAIFNLKTKKQEDINLKKALKDIQAMVTQANIRRNNRI